MTPNITHARTFFAHKDGRIFLPTHWVTNPIRSDNAWFPIGVVPFVDSPEMETVFERFYNDTLPIMKTEKWDTNKDMMDLLYKTVGVKSHKTLVNNAACFHTYIDKKDITCYFTPPNQATQWGDSIPVRVGAESDSFVLIAHNVLAIVRKFYQDQGKPGTAE